jgi:hypothetical protein
MADFAGTLARTHYQASFGGHPGILEFTYTLSATAYVANGVINISAVAPPSMAANQVTSIVFSIESSAAAYMPVFTPNGTPTLSNLGALQLFTATGTAATGSLTVVIRGRATLAGFGGVEMFR